MIEVFVLCIVLTANGAPILARGILQGRWPGALDAGLVLADGHPLFGPSKTWAGLAAAVLPSALLGWLFGFGWAHGLLLGLFAMLGDLFSSFIKRRLGMPPSAMVLGLDQIPESLFPLLVSVPLLGLDWSAVALLTLAFLVLELLLSRIAYHLGMRRQPH